MVAPASILMFLDPKGAKSRALHTKPTKMAKPPIRGVGFLCRCRALSVPALPGISMAPARSAAFMAKGVAKYAMRKAVSRAAAAATGAE